jgi:protein-S-isoprenylcysteine O-methyltransferase Ste14
MIRTLLLWGRGVIFTALVPLVVAGWAPAAIDPARRPAGGAWSAGWCLVAAGAAIYVVCLLRFLASGGTPAIFTRPLRALIGEEPPRLVQAWLYTRTRNPMYVGVVLAVIGQAVVFASQSIATYAVLLWLAFHFVVVAFEEPHLRDVHGRSYDDYCRRVPRWLVMLK